MRRPIDRLSLTTIVYFLIAIIISLIGLVLIAAPLGAKRPSPTAQSIGASLLAGGVASVGFGLLRYIDDAAENELRSEVEHSRSDLVSHFDTLRDGLIDFARRSANSVRITSQAKLRCVSDLEIGGKFRDEYTRFSLAAEPISVDVLGLKLYRFLEDQLSWLVANNHETRVRMLLQYPYGKVFEEICELEARNVRATREDITRTLDALDDATVIGHSLNWQSGRVNLQLRFFDRYQPVTMFRIQGTIYVRPRISTPQGAASRFYEIYESQDSPDHFNVQMRHFEQCWRHATYSPLEVSALQADVQQET